MLRCMRTTLNISDALLTEAKQTAARTGRTLTQIIEDALRESLARRDASRTAPRTIKLTTFKGTGVAPGVNLDDSAGLRDLMDEDAPA